MRSLQSLLFSRLNKPSSFSLSRSLCKGKPMEAVLFSTLLFCCHCHCVDAYTWIALPDNPKALDCNMGLQPPPSSSTSSFLRSACLFHLSGIYGYTDVPNTAGTAVMVLGPVWVFQVRNALVVSYSLGSQYCMHMHTIRLDFGKPSMNQPHPPQPA